jgi:hypothetical protein
MLTFQCRSVALGYSARRGAQFRVTSGTSAKLFLAWFVPEIIAEVRLAESILLYGEFGLGSPNSNRGTIGLALTAP